MEERVCNNCIHWLVCIFRIKLGQDMEGELAYNCNAYKKVD